MAQHVNHSLCILFSFLCLRYPYPVFFLPLLICSSVLLRPEMIPPCATPRPLSLLFQGRLFGLLSFLQLFRLPLP